MTENSVLRYFIHVLASFVKLPVGVDGFTARLVVIYEIIDEKSNYQNDP